MFGTNTTTIKVGGMMCDHCAATVKKAIEEIPDVKSAAVDLKSASVTIKYKGDFNEEAVKKALSDHDYAYNGVAS